MNADSLLNLSKSSTTTFFCLHFAPLIVQDGIDGLTRHLVLSDSGLSIQLPHTRNIGRMIEL
jgi:hypothetical protein